MPPKQRPWNPTLAQRSRKDGESAPGALSNFGALTFCTPMLIPLPRH